MLGLFVYSYFLTEILLFFIILIKNNHLKKEQNQQISQDIIEIQIDKINIRGNEILYQFDLPMIEQYSNQQHTEPKDNDNDNQTDQLERQFSRQQFVEVVSQLLKSMSIYDRNINVENAYFDLLTKNGKVIGKDIISYASDAREQFQSQKIINLQIHFYRQTLQQLRIKGITCISFIQFQELFANRGLISEQLTKQIKAKKIEFISLKKLQKIIQSMDNLSENNSNHPLIVETRILQQSQILHSKIADEQKQFIKTQAIIEYVNNKVMDAAIKNNLTVMLASLQKKIQQMGQSSLIQKQIEQSLRNGMEQLDNQLYQTQQSLDRKTSEIQRLYSKVKEQQQQIFQSIKTNQETVVQIVQPLEEENEKMRALLFQETAKNEQILQKLNWFEKNYEGLAKEYEQFIRAKQQKQEKDKIQKQQRLFTQRTIKEQLQDSQAKITRLRVENGELKNKLTQMAFGYENKIVELQTKIKQLEDSKEAYKFTRKYDASNIRNTYLNVNSHLGIEGRGSSIKNSSIQGSKISTVSGIRSSVITFQSIINESHEQANFKKKKQMISIRAEPIISDCDDEQHLEEDEIKILDKGKKQKEKDKKKQEQNEQSRSKTQNNLKPISQSPTKYSKRRVLSSLGYFINSDGNKYPTYIILSEDRFSFLDTKLRQNYSAKLSQLRKIIFCHHNQNWVVLKVKSNQFNEKQQKIYDIVFSVMNRSDILEFLHLRCSTKLFQSGTKLAFEKQDNIFIQAPDSQILLSNYGNFYNLNRISISNANHMFEANVKSNSLFNFGNDVLIIVTSIGILAFQKDGDYLLQKQQKLLYVIPIVQMMQISLAEDHKILLKYQTDKKLAYKIKMNSRVQAKKLKSIIEQQRNDNLNKQKSQIQKYSLLSSVLNKSMQENK